MSAKKPEEKDWGEIDLRGNSFNTDGWTARDSIAQLSGTFRVCERLLADNWKYIEQHKEKLGLTDRMAGAIKEKILESLIEMGMAAAAFEKYAATSKLPKSVIATDQDIVEDQRRKMEAVLSGEESGPDGPVN